MNATEKYFYSLLFLSRYSAKYNLTCLNLDTLEGDRVKAADLVVLDSNLPPWPAFVTRRWR